MVYCSPESNEKPGASLSSAGKDALVGGLLCRASTLLHVLRNGRDHLLNVRTAVLKEQEIEDFVPLIREWAR